MSVTGHTSADTPADQAAKGGKSVSIRDVAAAAGVSYQTVSRVINGNASVKEATRERVQEAIRALGFRPNAAARALANRDTRSLTVVTSNTTLYGYAATLQGVEEAARAAGFTVGISVLESEADEHVRATVNRAADSSSGLVVIAYDSAGVRALDCVPDGHPVSAAVEAPAGPLSNSLPRAWIDDAEAAAEATRYLLELGHPTVHYVALPSTTHASRRTAGWRAALEAAGAPVPEPVGAGWDAVAGYDAGRRLAQDPGVTAVLCGNDDLALGVLRAMYEAGRPVPGQVSVVGFDNAPQSAFYTPALTTVEMDFTDLGRACFALLHDVLAGTSTAAALPPVPRPRLVVRESADVHHPAPTP
ncbi:transcriptional regulator [Streptacidiphilus pinicola]|uniref:Transcriptional regulator n=1 Tax=Streptacidiphilus pinicola TaxID=2219663 RepID=A0A2X0KI69_9ACTN|nr:substrate-binding domain-containing protein [Streptacidiphilus pinicola]RAG86450.1 transcriptional regulator [Streptacidiphilus pinicola]